MLFIVTEGQEYELEPRKVHMRGESHIRSGPSWLRTALSQPKSPLTLYAHSWFLFLSMSMTTCYSQTDTINVSWLYLKLDHIVWIGNTSVFICRKMGFNPE